MLSLTDRPYIPPSDMKRRLRRFMEISFNQLSLKSPFICTRLDLSLYTKCPTRYTDLIRILHPLFLVNVYRNDSNIKEGIYIAGRTSQVHIFRSAMVYIIESIEANSLKYEPMTPQRHLGPVYHYYKNQLIIKAMHVGLDLRDEHPKLLGIYTARAYQDKILLDDYTKTLPILRTKKKFYALKSIPHPSRNRGS